MQQERLSYLLKRYKQGLLTEEETEELEALCSQEQEPELLDWIRHKMETQISGPAKIPAAELEALAAAILSVDKDGKTVHAEGPVGQGKVHRLKVVGWAAAAAILLAVATGIHYYMENRPKQPVITRAKEMPPSGDEVAPGGNKAVLILANGNKIILDSTQRGVVTTQGNNKVIKVDSGMIAYDPRSAAKPHSGPVAFNTLSTPMGGQYQLKLPDGTRVWLNAASSITFPTVFTGKAREVEVTGETYFEVAPNAGMPFMVKKGNVQVRVLGTHFNVNAYDNEDALRVTLLQGGVRIFHRINGHSATLRPGEQAEVDPAGNIGVDAGVDTSAAVAWKNGQFRFNNTNLAELLRQLARWYNVTVVYTGNMKDYAHRYAFVGEIERSSDLSLVLRLLELGGVHFKMRGRSLIVMP